MYQCQNEILRKFQDFRAEMKYFVQAAGADAVENASKLCAMEDQIRALHSDVREFAHRAEIERNPAASAEISTPVRAETERNLEVSAESSSAVQLSMLRNVEAAERDDLMSSDLREQSQVQSLASAARPSPAQQGFVDFKREVRDELKQFEDKVFERMEQFFKEKKDDSDEVLSALGQIYSTIEQQGKLNDLVLTVTTLLPELEDFKKIVLKKLENVEERQIRDVTWSRDASRSREKLTSMLEMLENFIDSSSKKIRDAREGLECLIRRLEYEDRQDSSVNQTEMISTILYFLLHLHTVSETMV